ncbi:helix-turn-helix domain-containing protein [Chitinimonas arctica]|uniref:Helix-turn-helix domain-containing protein n=1 Tax=Chitinimonas arctica TaxID=2594795 RepID=A0A516S9Z6_9NEIS|nr:helix-turn-helix domain-containing protein [Chitinimonas arctica]QDQ24868.1 helix-turn-helix domain-containing protein [Chitinimonas arctica]
MKYILQLSDAERLTLQQLSLNHRHRDIRTRAAGLLLLARGLKPKEAAKELSVSHPSIYNWTKTWNENGICGLLTGHNGGRYAALSADMIATALSVANQEAVSLRKIADHIRAEYGSFPCTLETLSTAMKTAGQSYKRIRYSHKSLARQKNAV